ncbi:MAG: 3-isopropylmalate dehydratase small subunit [Oscillospiraceae bacterium]|nr:3-isopropylmalate dehydratase small subunit [Oscillospiraceae bacterium]
MLIRERIIKYGDNIDTDVIIPARYLNTADENELAKHCMEDIDPCFHEKLKTGSIIVAGGNFGCGSSREHAPIAIKASGAACVIAKDFARIFFRNAINIGLPIVECPEAVIESSEHDEFIVDLDNGVLKNLTKDKRYIIQPFPDFLQKIINSGGLMNMAEELVWEAKV